MRKSIFLLVLVAMAFGAAALFSTSSAGIPSATNDGYKTSSLTIHGDSEDDRAWVFITGDSSEVSAHSKDIRRAQKVRQGDEDLFYFRKGDDAWVLRDAQSIAAVERILEPQRALGREQSKLGEAQSRLGDKQSELGASQSKLGAKQGELGRLQGQAAQASARGDDDARLKAQELQRELAAMQKELGRRQGELGRQQGLLGKEQGKLGRLQGELGRKQGELAKLAWGEFAEMVEVAVEEGRAVRLR